MPCTAKAWRTWSPSRGQHLQVERHTLERHPLIACVQHEHVVPTQD